MVVDGEEVAWGLFTPPPAANPSADAEDPRACSLQDNNSSINRSQGSPSDKKLWKMKKNEQIVMTKREFLLFILISKTTLSLISYKSLHDSYLIIVIY